MTGTAVVVDAEETIARFAAMSAEKYAGFSTPRSEYPEETRKFYEARDERTHYRIDTEERIISWDNSKLGLA